MGYIGELTCPVVGSVSGSDLPIGGVLEAELSCGGIYCTMETELSCVKIFEEN
jgi:hypothetical protein